MHVSVNRAAHLANPTHRPLAALITILIKCGRASTTRRKVEITKLPSSKASDRIENEVSETTPGVAHVQRRQRSINSIPSNTQIARYGDLLGGDWSTVVSFRGHVSDSKRCGSTWKSISKRICIPFSARKVLTKHLAPIFSPPRFLFRVVWQIGNLLIHDTNQLANYSPPDNRSTVSLCNTDPETERLSFRQKVVRSAVGKKTNTHAEWIRKRWFEARFASPVNHFHRTSRWQREAPNELLTSSQVRRTDDDATPLNKKQKWFDPG